MQFDSLEVPVPSQNGEEVKVPVSLIRKKDLRLDGTAPCLLSAYGYMLCHFFLCLTTLK